MHPAAVGCNLDRHNSLREAADHIVRENIGRLPVVSREDPKKVVGFITRSDLLKAHERRLDETGASAAKPERARRHPSSRLRPKS